MCERWTEDGGEDMEVVKGECDVFLDGCGLARVADLLGV
jgi:hypothetical protein